MRPQEREPVLGRFGCDDLRRAGRFPPRVDANEFGKHWVGGQRHIGHSPAQLDQAARHVIGGSDDEQAGDPLAVHPGCGLGRVADGVDLFAGFGYTDAEFDKFIDSYAGDVSNNKLTFAPEHTWNVGAQYKRPMFDGIDLLARLEFTGVGRFFYDPGNTQVQRNYILTNLRLGLRARNWHIEGWVRNALDEDYIPVAFQIGPDSFVGESGAPRTFGFTVGVEF